MAIAPFNHVMEQQISREQLARTRQVIEEMQIHYNNYENQVRMMQHNIKNQEDALAYSSHILELNRCRDNIIRHINSYNQMIQLANVQFKSNLSDQAKREIYHFYHSGRYTQDQLAAHYSVQQSTISKIVNGPAPIA
ncbi:hypothetical protein QVM88_17385 [Providencia stuartii]|uniref:hypothetical protein n=1 Tax=Providencia stuartii TaxID=588 RepID=UPI0025AB2980|nr:hypothetical protein [Providencia stuartii]MDN0008060.1 hypothetical protein [Providencia stuartii]